MRYSSSRHTNGRPVKILVQLVADMWIKEFPYSSVPQAFIGRLVWGLHRLIRMVEVIEAAENLVLVWNLSKQRSCGISIPSQTVPLAAQQLDQNPTKSYSISTVSTARSQV